MALMGTLADASQHLVLAGFVIPALGWRGEFSQARALCADLGHDARAQAAVWARIFSGAWMGFLIWQEAEHEAACTALNEGLAMGRESGIHLLDPMLYVHLAYTALSAGDVDAAERALGAGWP
jgi:hypothetical protein